MSMILKYKHGVDSNTNNNTIKDSINIEWNHPFGFPILPDGLLKNGKVITDTPYQTKFGITKDEMEENRGIFTLPIDNNKK